MRAIVAIGTVAVLVAAAAPAAGDASPQERADRAAALDHARGLWKAAGLRDYDLRIQRQCFCSPETRKRITIKFRHGRTRHVPEEYRSVRTVPRLFAFIEANLSNDELGVDYDSRRGWPSRIASNPSFRIADEEMGYAVKVTRR